MVSRSHDLVSRAHEILSRANEILKKRKQISYVIYENVCLPLEFRKNVQRVHNSTFSPVFYPRRNILRLHLCLKGYSYLWGLSHTYHVRLSIQIGRC